MVEIYISTVVIVLSVFWILYRFISFFFRKKLNYGDELKQFLIFVCVIVIIRFTFFPFSKVNGNIQPLLFDLGNAYPFRVNFVPFVYLFDYPDGIHSILINLFGNIFMFVPLGFLLPVVYKKLDTFWKVTAAGALFSFLIEIIQLPFYVRVSDIDDLILNTLGCMMGYGFYSLIRSFVIRM